MAETQRFLLAGKQTPSQSRVPGDKCQEVLNSVGPICCACGWRPDWPSLKILGRSLMEAGEVLGLGGLG